MIRLDGGLQSSDENADLGPLSLFPKSPLCQERSFSLLPPSKGGLESHDLSLEGEPESEGVEFFDFG